MANLKLDLLNKLRNDKYYDELELVRLAQEPNMNYEQKIKEMSYYLERLSILNAQMGLVEQYFQEPVAAQNVPVQNAPAGVVHQGQTHGE
jgi:hypothetical protein